MGMWSHRAEMLGPVESAATHVKPPAARQGYQNSRHSLPRLLGNAAMGRMIASWSDESRESQGESRSAENVSSGESAGPAVQARTLGNVRARTADETHAAARYGVASGASALPYMERIQRSFGMAHDISAVQAHVGPTAAEANHRMGAEAFVSGEHAVFKDEQPSLRTAAHEAAHVIQQRHGVALTAGVGEPGDAYERHADAVADRVVEGGSAAPLLDVGPGAAQGAGSPAAAVQQKADKEVSNNALVRLQMAKGAMESAKSILSFGAGNQVEALRSSKFNSNFRLQLARDVRYWEVSKEVADVVESDPDLYHAARAYVAKGGNCGEHSLITYELLKQLAKGQRISRVATKGLDHAFVIIGDLSVDDGKKAEEDPELVVADPWPTAPTANLWPDHFAYTAKREDIEVSNSTKAKGETSLLKIAAGIKLNKRGLELLNKTKSDAEVEAEIGRSEANHFWNHTSSAGKDKDFNYYTNDAMGRRVELIK